MLSCVPCLATGHHGLLLLDFIHCAYPWINLLSGIMKHILFLGDFHEQLLGLLGFKNREREVIERREGGSVKKEGTIGGTEQGSHAIFPLIWNMVISGCSILIMDSRRLSE